MDDELFQALLAPYLQLVTREHADKPRFLATIAASIHGLLEQQALLSQIVSLYDLDNAVGDQLDTVGKWAGVSRFLETLLPDVFFEWDTEGLGWDQGVWLVPYVNASGFLLTDSSPPRVVLDDDGNPVLVAPVALTKLEDDHYRLLIKARIAANNWDGTIPGAYDVWNQLFETEGWKILIQDGMAAAVNEFAWDDYAWRGWDKAQWRDDPVHRANFLRNNAMLGAGIGYPGRLPTYWESYGGLTIDVTGIYVGDRSVDCINLVFRGTTISGETDIYFEETTPDRLNARPGETWTLSCWFQELIGNGFITGTFLDISARDATGTELGIASQKVESNRFYFQRISVTYASLPTGTVSLRVRLRHTHPASVDISGPYAFTIGSPQLELSDIATARIQTRGAPVLVDEPEMRQDLFFEWDAPLPQNGWDDGYWSPYGPFLPEARLNGAMHMIYALIAPYSPPPLPPEFFRWDEGVYFTWDDYGNEPRHDGIPAIAMPPRGLMYCLPCTDPTLPEVAHNTLFARSGDLTMASTPADNDIGVDFIEPTSYATYPLIDYVPLMESDVVFGSGQSLSAGTNVDVDAFGSATVTRI